MFVIREGEFTRLKLITTSELSGAKHSACFRMLSWYESDNNLYVIMELCEGGELFDVIDKREELYSGKHKILLIHDWLGRLGRWKRRQIIL